MESGVIQEPGKKLKKTDDIWFDQINRQDEVIYTQALMRGIIIGYWTVVAGLGVGQIEV